MSRIVCALVLSCVATLAAAQEPQVGNTLVLVERDILYSRIPSFRQVTFRQADQSVWNLISDHCPVVVELWVP